jgi:shikimate kinase
MKRLLILVGPKGSGKTTIGSLVARYLPIHFFRVEPVFIQNQADGALEGEALVRRGFDRVARRLDELFEEHSMVMIESTGAHPQFSELLAGYREKYELKLIRLRVPLRACEERARARDSRDHLAVSDDRLKEINAIADRLELAWDLELDNSGPATNDEILRAFEPLLTDSRTHDP